jgi:hypothetical protein
MAKANQDLSPSELLRESPEARLEYFKTCTIKHPMLADAFEEVRSAILDSIPGSIILLFGPTGAGKTTLLERLCKSLMEYLLEDLKRNKGRFPIVLVQLDSPLPGKFDWRDYFRSILIELREPEIERKLNVDEWPTKKLDNNFITRILEKESNNHISGGAMRVSARQALKNRKPLAVLVDDAQHFGQIGSGRKLLNQLNIIKSLAEKSEVIHVLCGTYELLPFLNLNGQLSRRIIDVHFGRYHADDEMQREAFISVLYTFQHYLPLNETPDLVSQWDYFYEGSVGCVGILKDWLTRAFALALTEKSHILLPKHLEKRVLSIAKRDSILREILTGEEELKEQEATRAQLRLAMGLKQEIRELTFTAEEDNHTEDNSAQASNTRPKRRNRSVGKRSPTRDKIGTKVA